MADALLTIKSAAEKFGLSPVYIRRAIHQEKLETSLEPIAEGSKTQQHVFTEEAFAAWRASAATRSQRGDGRRKWALYAGIDDGEIDAIKAAISKALPDYDVDALIQLANPPKSN